MGNVGAIDAAKKAALVLEGQILATLGDHKALRFATPGHGRGRGTNCSEVGRFLAFPGNGGVGGGWAGRGWGRALAEFSTQDAGEVASVRARRAVGGGGWPLASSLAPKDPSTTTSAWCSA